MFCQQGLLGHPATDRRLTNIDAVPDVSTAQALFLDHADDFQFRAWIDGFTLLFSFSIPLEVDFPPIEASVQIRPLPPGPDNDRMALNLGGKKYTFAPRRFFTSGKYDWHQCKRCRSTRRRNL